MSFFGCVSCVTSVLCLRVHNIISYWLNVFPGNQRLCSQDIEEIRGKDSWKSECLQIFCCFFLLLLFFMHVF